MVCAKDLIAQLKLAPHPEGGWYRETWRADATQGERASATLIYFLLEADQLSHWHTVDAAELWLWHSGDPLQLSTSMRDSAEVDRSILGPDLLGGHVAQQVVYAGDWQAARVMPGDHGFALVSCVVSPGFEFEGFTLAPPAWRPEA